MKIPGLIEGETGLIEDVLNRRPEIQGVILYGSRATGTAELSSDIDLALVGISDPLKAAAIASELDERPLPYKFDVRALDSLRSTPLLESIRASGIPLQLRGTCAP